MSLLPVRTMLPYGHSGCKPGAGAGVGSGLGRHGRFAQRLARGAKGKRVIQARMMRKRRQIEAHRGHVALTDFRVKAPLLGWMRFLSGIIANAKGEKDNALAGLLYAGIPRSLVAGSRFYSPSPLPWSDRHPTDSPLRPPRRPTRARSRSRPE